MVAVQATYSAGLNGPMLESTFTSDSEIWTTKNTRIIAMRKEKSRDAARSRRGKENYEYYELAKMLPLPAAITSQLDKASIIRLTMSYLKIRDFALQGDPTWHNYNLEGSGVGRGMSSVLQGRYNNSRVSSRAQDVYEHNLGGHLLQALDGFLFALCSDGRFLYISETVSIYLGLSQVELTGSSFFDYVHVGDHAELAEHLGMKLPPTRSMSQSSLGAGSEGGGTSPLASPTSPYAESHTLNMTSPDTNYHRSFVIRMKSTLTKRGVHIKSSGYKVIHVTGAMRPRLVLAPFSRASPVIMGFTAVAQSLPPPTINEIHLEPSMFVCKLDMDLTILFCEPKIQEFMDMSGDDVTGKSFYSFLHAQDISNMKSCHNDLLNKGQMVTNYYRWMGKSGGYIWLQSTATLSYARTSNDRSFMFINQVISNIEQPETAMAISQLSSQSLDVKSDGSDASSDHESDSTATGEGKTIPQKNEKLYHKSAHQKTILSHDVKQPQAKAPWKARKRRSSHSHTEAKKHRVGSQEDVRGLVREQKTVIVEHVLASEPASQVASQTNARKPKKVFEDQHARQLLENRATSANSPESISPNVHSRDSDISYGKDSDAGSNWDSAADIAGGRSYHDLSVTIGNSEIIVIPNNGVVCSPDSDSLLTPPLSDNCHSQYVLPTVISFSDAKNKQFTESNALMMSNNNNVQVSKGFHQPAAISPDIELVIHDESVPKSHTDNMECLTSRPGHVYNDTHPRVISSVPSAYATMPYSTYGQYTNFQQYSNQANLVSSRRGYQTYADPYKSFRSAQHDMPMDLSYNNLGSYLPNMSVLHSTSAVATPHMYYHPTKIAYSSVSESGDVGSP